jgi:hypothetical protein
MNLGFGATRRLHGCARRAGLGLGALDDGASGAGARRAIPYLTRLVTRANTGRARRHRRLEHVLGHVGGCGALRLKHIATHVGLGRAGRNGRLQDILGPVYLGALVTVFARYRAIAAIAGATTYVARRLCHIYEPFYPPDSAEQHS